MHLVALQCIAVFYIPSILCMFLVTAQVSRHNLLHSVRLCDYENRWRVFFLNSIGRTVQTIINIHSLVEQINFNLTTIGNSVCKLGLN